MEGQYEAISDREEWGTGSMKIARLRNWHAWGSSGEVVSLGGLLSRSD